MAILKTDDLKEGMKVTKPVEVNGRIIVGTGKELTSKMLSLFKAWGIVEVEVSGEHDVDTDNYEQLLSHEELNSIKNKIDQKFKNLNTNNEIMMEIRKILIKKNSLKFLKEKTA